ncbi:hypothetical protein KAR91_22260 [Candidatus Pacearchaeota archaeon]|nr:hypothetical protein [Candidatus Pacearchaeota archaeon]
MKPEELAQLKSRYFKDHKATVRELAEGVTDIVWQKEKDSNCYVVYLIRGNVLYVSGDLGSAVYFWGRRLSIEWLAGLNIDYFASKCEASEHGRLFRSWASDVAEKWIESFVKDHIDDCYDEEGEAEALAVFNELKEDMERATDSKEEWIAFASGDDGRRVFGDEWWDYAADIGTVVDFRCRTHLAGLKLINEQVNGKD